MHSSGERLGAKLPVCLGGTLHPTNPSGLTGSVLRGVALGNGDRGVVVEVACFSGIVAAGSVATISVAVEIIFCAGEGDTCSAAGFAAVSCAQATVLLAISTPEIIRQQAALIIPGINPPVF
jgi:hypothetical protein